MLSQRHLVLAVIACALLLFASSRTKSLTPVLRSVEARTTGSFTEGDGWYPGERFAGASPRLRAWGSWTGDDAHTGSLALGPFPAPRLLRFGVGGYPNDPNNALYVERVEDGQKHLIAFPAVGERWHICDLILPSDWEGRAIRLVATDNATGLGGWIAITEPLRGGRGDGNNALLETLGAWTLNGLLLGVLFAAAARQLAARTALAPHWISLAAFVAVALAAYVALWCYLAHPWLGWAASGLLLLGALLSFRRPARTESSGPDFRTATALLLALGGFYLCALHLFPTSHDFYTLAANRFSESLPEQNLASHAAAERIFAGTAAVEIRSPLQTGWQLLTWPAAKFLQLDRKTFSGTAALWLQLAWITAAYGLLRHLALTPRRAAAWTAALGLAGVLLQSTTFTSPQLPAAAFALAASALVVVRTSAAPRAHHLLAGLCAAIACLCDSSALLVLITALLWVIVRFRQDGLRPWLLPLALAIGLILPALALPTTQETPARSLALAAQPLEQLQRHVGGDWKQLASVSPEQRSDRRNEELTFTGRALTWWPLLTLFTLTLTRRPRLRPTASGRVPLLSPELLQFSLWSVLALLATTFLTFRPAAHPLLPPSAIILALLILLSAILDRAGRAWLLALAALQTVTLATNWLPANLAILGPADGLPLLLLTAAIVAGFIVRGFLFHDEASLVAEPQPAPTGAPLLSRSQVALVLLAIAALMFLRKPHALHTPQLWAEDGSIFLVQNDTHGLAALAYPYAGYLHTIPRLIAFAASRLADPAWWPAFYNICAFAIWFVVIARLFSPRLPIPAKPWLAVALIAVPHNGEVFFNVTNLQWLTAFVLVQQLLIAPPRTRAQHVSDFLILVVISLTGPFGVAFLPLFFARWVLEARDPSGLGPWLRALFSSAHRASFLAFATVFVCAGIQAAFVVRTGPRFDYQSEPFELLPTLEILTRRLLAWPILGREIAFTLPALALAALGTCLITALVCWVLRPHPLRAQRLTVLAAFALITLAAVYRTRPDTWAADNLDYGDRYFYIPRVLLAWLLIWEFHAAPRAVAVCARLACLLAVVLHLRAFVVPAPRDYEWAKHVEPIRRGVPANIPTLPEGWTLEYLGRK